LACDGSLLFLRRSILNRRSSQIHRPDYVDLVKSEVGKEERPLSTSYGRRGGTELYAENRVKLDKLLDAEMKNELDRNHDEAALRSPEQECLPLGDQLIFSKGAHQFSAIILISFILS